MKNLIKDVFLALLLAVMFVIMVVVIYALGFMFNLPM